MKNFPVTIKTETATTINLDLETAAKWFCGLSDDEQCRFFVAVAREAESFGGGYSSQWFFVGSHLRNCECSTDDAREIVREMHRGLETGRH